MMEDMGLIWNVVLTLIVAPAAYYLQQQAAELKRIQILLNMTREEYMKRSDHVSETDRIMEALRRLEDKIDRISERDTKR